MTCILALVPMPCTVVGRAEVALFEGARLDRFTALKTLMRSKCPPPSPPFLPLSLFFFSTRHENLFNLTDGLVVTSFCLIIPLLLAGRMPIIASSLTFSLVRSSVSALGSIFKKTVLRGMGTQKKQGPVCFLFCSFIQYYVASMRRRS